MKLFDKMTGRVQVIFSFLSCVFAILAAVCVVTDLITGPERIAIFVVAGLLFLCSCAFWVRLILGLFRLVILPFTDTSHLVRYFFLDYRLRTIMLALPGLGTTLLFAVFNLILGIVMHSSWYASLAVAYIFLCAMKFFSVAYARKLYFSGKPVDDAFDRERQVYRTCGILLSILSIAFMGAVLMLVFGGGSGTHSRNLTLAIVIFALYKICVSVFHVYRIRNAEDSLMKALRNISYTDILVSLLHLQTALLHSMGEAGRFHSALNIGAGILAAGLSLILGISMLGILKEKNNR